MGDVGFYDLATCLYDKVDWAHRAERGADGAPPPAQRTVTRAPSTALTGLPAVEDGAGVATLAAAAASGVVVLDFGAAWCKKCADVEPAVASLAARLPGVAFATVDVDHAEALVEQYAVSAVPHFVVLKGGAKVAEYVGSDGAELARMLLGVAPAAGERA